MLTVGRSAHFSFDKHFGFGGIRSCLKALSSDAMDFEFLPTEFAAYSEPPSRDNYREGSHPRTQQRD